MSNLIPNINPLELVSGQLSAINASSFNPGNLTSLLPAQVQSSMNKLSSELIAVGGAANSFANKFSPPKAKKTITFTLYDKDGNPVKANGQFQSGYQFTMSVNPASLTINYPTKSISPVRTMGGWVIQHWFPELGGISANGIIGNLLQPFSPSTKDTPRWKDFSKLLNVYLNNGVAFQPGADRNATTFNPEVVCVYDRVTYTGFFENFSLTEEEGQPYTRNYTFEFKFTKMVDTTDIAAMTIGNISAIKGRVLGAAGQGLAGITPTNLGINPSIFVG